MDKYDLYRKSVQEPAEDARHFRQLHRELTGRAPKRLREDFCGTFGVCCEWVKLGPDYTAQGLDLSEEALDYGRRHYLSKLTPGQRARVAPTLCDVLEPVGPAPDLILAQNFSYFIFKERATLVRYFAKCRESLRRGGVLALDAFGGADALVRNRESTKYRGHVFYWEQYDFDPVTHDMPCAIHFKLKGRRKVKDVFTYDWRLWSLPEIRDALADAGFRKSHVYWEGDDGKEGNGVFTRVDKGAVEPVWIAMILAEK